MSIKTIDYRIGLTLDVKEDYRADREDLQTEKRRFESMARQIRFNAFDMNCVGHQSPGLWAHPRDRSYKYKDLDYWQDLALTLERGVFDGIFIADVIGYYDVYRGSNFHAIQQAAQIPVNDPLQLTAPIALATEH